jgi:hypothetical protein
MSLSRQLVAQQASRSCHRILQQRLNLAEAEAIGLLVAPAALDQQPQQRREACLKLRPFAIEVPRSDCLHILMWLAVLADDGRQLEAIGLKPACISCHHDEQHHTE